MQHMLARGSRRAIGLGLLWLWGCAGESSSVAPEPERGAAEVTPARVAAGTPLSSERDSERAQLQEQVLRIESETGEPPLALSTDSLRTVLDYYCGDCHFPSVNQLGDGLFYMDDIEKLVATGKILPGAGEQSRLVQRVRLGEMPPLSSGFAAMPASTLDRISQYIDALPAPVQQAPLPPAPPLILIEPRPDVPPAQASCFAYLGDWIRCEHEGYDADKIDIPGKDLERCFRACRERDDCVAVTDYTWLDLPELGCYLYLSRCDAPATGPWHEEDGGRQYVKQCASD